MAADELVTILGVDVSTETMANLSKFKDGLDGVMAKLRTLQLVTAGMLTAAGFFVKGVVDEVAALDKLSKTSGLSTDTLQEWSYAAKQVGVDANAIQGDLVNLNKTMSSPIPGQFNANIAMLGVSVRGANGELKDTSTLLEEMGGRLSQMSHQQAFQWGQKVGLSDDTIVLLRQGSEGLAALKKEASEMGAIIPSDAIKRAMEFNRSLAQLSEAFRGLSSQLAISALPALQRVTEVFRDWIVRNREWIAINTAAFMTGLVSAFEKVWGVIKNVLSIFQPLVDKFNDLTGAMDTTEHWTHLLQGAIAGLLLLFSPIIAKLAVLGAAFYAASLIIEDFMYWLNGDESLIGKGIKAFADRFPGIAKLFETVRDIARDLFEGALKVGAATLQVLGDAAAQVFGSLLDAIDSVAGPLAEFFATFAEKYPAVVEAVTAIAGVVGGALKTALGGIITILQELFGFGGKVFNFLLEKIEALFGKVNSFMEWLGFGGDEAKKESGTPEGGTAGALTAPTKYAAISNVPLNGERFGGMVPTQATPSGTGQGGNVINDSRTVSTQITVVSNDPQQAGQSVLNALDNVQTQIPGSYTPNVR